MQPMNDVVDGGCLPEALDYFTSRRPEAWSAALVPVGTAPFIVENSAHTLQRRRSNVAHEMSHLLLEHQFEGILFADGGCRDLGPEMALKEKQAAALSGELLIPMAAAIGAALSGRTDEQVAEQFDCVDRPYSSRLGRSGSVSGGDRRGGSFVRGECGGIEFPVRGSRGARRRRRCRGPFP
ncbi:hypothetical protein SGFS_010520 [Streptomyces graminofaciens]|uniref:IrrE N-terminal-like domain-containing protein n=2 Tax=Streptomyces graminofaciens TaxID=68212 RepID=A0ABM7F202_9ACTN|nr:hypothetical protein SGFS_010520 [Streptomyces graminofaciens]